ncbi:MAG: ribosomal protein S18-alanine N-acetyltransferase [Lachnospiraceae bacterium]|nr:ribosomal protein S18-alanine N-acetyltransferase [Lachnospiraceae bacterium]
MEITDCDMAAKMEEELFSDPWSKKALEDAILRCDSCYRAAREDGKLIGYCGLYLVGDEGYINQVAVTEERQGRGIGKELLSSLLSAAAEKGMKACSLEVRTSNQRAVRLYESLGFEKDGVRPGFYDHPKEDAYIMWKR